MPAVPSSVLTTAGLIGGYTVARATGDRPLGGAVLAAFGAAAFETWRRRSGVGTAVALTGVYVGAFGLSHPLAKKVGAWPAVLGVTAVTAAVAAVSGDLDRG
ncbi:MULTISPECIES: hypothetical protein [Nocardiopsis]|uniref:ATP-dependent protease Clp, ATPase subunit n=1 Tax=Nocardiopsis dassonvillei (strain ATCC 23218 / DSM 43111 / CIP 107115 / JCM 7437 / KCTC 9190 / NBRC 14626 / NCTC 10488 / NRRL B-5397 / IMRU 509) TaxID=446468 RepID=D7B341_NOCDD|nr:MULTISPECIES: hypothetical protein [Nocardiopsis]ADH68731.1 ATP-dependent protease Clp, ATPase subunit [Nocardiopsis dassonvillei subsp. dassonvillei DSM 43111]APC36791.1 hypothetical protein A9R04_19855 [Nocardiopsis dassonvillei]NKY78041.1 hypothetical protein [Nocardiopsis dassonvillei]VEI89240.1 Uncharacterised protein [Nocardiopsis dassonvillei]